MGTLEDSRYIPALKKANNSLCFVRVPIVPHPQNLKVDGVRAKAALEVSSALNKLDSLGVYSALVVWQ